MSDYETYHQEWSRECQGCIGQKLTYPQVVKGREITTEITLMESDDMAITYTDVASGKQMALAIHRHNGDGCDCGNDEPNEDEEQVWTYGCDAKDIEDGGGIDFDGTWDSQHETVEDALNEWIASLPSLYDLAEDRLYSLDSITADMMEVCLRDCGEGDSHLMWLIAAPEAQIREWAESILHDEAKAEAEAVTTDERIDY